MVGGVSLIKNPGAYGNTFIFGGKVFCVSTW